MMTKGGLVVLDGPIGTELAARGVDTSLPLWSARGVLEAPQTLAEIHSDYGKAGARVHTANTFRTKRRTLGDQWRHATTRAVAIARGAVPTNSVPSGTSSRTCTL